MPISDERRTSFLDIVLTGAKSNLTRDHNLLPVAFLLREDGMDLIPIPFTETNKRETFLKVGLVAYNAHAEAIAVLNDVAMKSYESPEDAKKALADPLERPLLYPKSQRVDAIFISYMDMCTRARSHIIQPYKEIDTGYEWLPQYPESPMDDTFLDYICLAWEHMEETMKGGAGAQT